MGETRLEDWIGRVERLTDHVAPTPIRALAATLGDQVAFSSGDPVPELRHWLSFLPLSPAAEIGPDGHPRRGAFLPPIPLERRMWAGGRLTFHDRLRIGDAVERTSTILKLTEKAGKAGAMVFVTVAHAVTTERGLAIEEEQDLVFLPMPTTYAPPAPELAPSPAEMAWSEPVAVDEVLLFRFSALTFNAHRIHYDLPYATGTERYPGLVVHGPLQAMLLLDAARRHAPERVPGRFRFRAVRPLFHFDYVRIVARPDSNGESELCTTNGDGHVGMRATVTWAG
jgi:3-methylfumaryl-CoA hydratase